MNCCVGIIIASTIIETFDSIFFEFGITVVEYMRVTRIQVDHIKSKKDLKKIHDKQILISDLMKQINEYFWVSLFVQYLTIAVSICILGFQLLEMKDLSMTVTHLGYVLSQMSRLCVINYVGDKIRDEVGIID